ncbi:hypothetical protein [Legionella sainthelensi]|nr:hypothetical protein [Legionella sainthelensi]
MIAHLLRNTLESGKEKMSFFTQNTKKQTQLDTLQEMQRPVYGIK